MKSFFHKLIQLVRRRFCRHITTRGWRHDHSDTYNMTCDRCGLRWLEPVVVRDNLGPQGESVYRYMAAHPGWHTLGEIAAGTQHPEASVSARIRDLRKLGLTVDRRYLGGANEYRLVA
jgi:hypothetical protein